MFSPVKGGKRLLRNDFFGEKIFQTEYKTMQRILLRVSFISIATAFSVLFIQAQDTSKPVSVDPNLITLENARIPKEYTIAGIQLTGVHFLDSSIVLSIANIQ